MKEYTITIEVTDETAEDKYSSKTEIYKQVVTGDDTIVSGVVQTVLDFTKPVVESARKVN